LPGRAGHGRRYPTARRRGTLAGVLADAGSAANPAGAHAQLTLAYALGFLLSVAIFQVGRFVPLIASNVNALVAAVFLYVPAWLLWRRGDDPRRRAGAQPVRKSLVVIALYLFVVMPLFIVGFAISIARPACACPR